MVYADLKIFNCIFYVCLNDSLRCFNLVFFFCQKRTSTMSYGFFVFFVVSARLPFWFCICCEMFVWERNFTERAFCQCVLFESCCHFLYKKVNSLV